MPQDKAAKLYHKQQNDPGVMPGRMGDRVPQGGLRGPADAKHAAAATEPEDRRSLDVIPERQALEEPSVKLGVAIPVEEIVTMVSTSPAVMRGIR